MGWSNLSLGHEETKSTKKGWVGKKKLLRNVEKWEPWGKSSAIVKAQNSLGTALEDQKLYEEKGGICLGNLKSIWVIPRWCKSFLCPHSADNDESFKAQLWKSWLCWKCARGLLEGNSAEMKSVLPPPTAPGTSGIPSNGGTGRVKCLLSCSQKIGWVLAVCFFCSFMVFLNSLKWCAKVWGWWMNFQ